MHSVHRHDLRLTHLHDREVHTHAILNRVFLSCEGYNPLPSPTVMLCERRVVTSVSFVSGGPSMLPSECTIRSELEGKFTNNSHSASAPHDRERTWRVQDDPDFMFTCDVDVLLRNACSPGDEYEVTKFFRNQMGF